MRELKPSVFSFQEALKSNNTAGLFSSLCSSSRWFSSDPVVCRFRPRAVAQTLHQPAVSGFSRQETAKVPLGAQGAEAVVV